MLHKRPQEELESRCIAHLGLSPGGRLAGAFEFDSGRVFYITRYVISGDDPAF
jgi:hypothetical protein